MRDAFGAILRNAAIRDAFIGASAGLDRGQPFGPFAGAHGPAALPIHVIDLLPQAALQRLRVGVADLGDQRLGEGRGEGPWVRVVRHQPGKPGAGFG